MGVRFNSVASTALANALPASNAETVVVILPPLTIALDFAQLFILWFFNITSGASVTANVFRVRRGTTVAGTTVGGPDTHTLAAAAAANCVGIAIDTPGAVAGQQYCLTISQTAATGAGTANDIAMIAFSL